jgi:UDP-N-acetylglucosamine--N-acetylmuramyl-(pentapeptide) pyrophosphoryl-undecaprenol N-acetylglucosamine transferase
VLLAAGGTGGHLFPAFALAEELGRRGIAVDLVTDVRGDRYGVGSPVRHVYQVPSATVSGKSPVALARAGFTLVRGGLAARALLKRLKPGAVIGFGGYPTFPPLVAARLLAIPSAVHEQNAVLGRANRALAKSVRVIATSFETTKFVDGEQLAKARFTGNPVRDVVIKAAERPYDPPALGGALRLLVFGGSQGARVFADVVPAALAGLDASLRGRLKVTQQAREEDQSRVEAAYAAAGIAAEVQPFFADLPTRMAASHLVIARAGASTVAEVTVIGRPSILVPLPHSLDNDQLANATRLAESGGSWCIEQKDLTPERLAREVERLARDPAALEAAARAAKSQGRPDAVKRLADLVEGLIGTGGAAARGEGHRSGARTG